MDPSKTVDGGWSSSRPRPDVWGVEVRQKVGVPGSSPQKSFGTYVDEALGDERRLNDREVTGFIQCPGTPVRVPPVSTPLTRRQVSDGTGARPREEGFGRGSQCPRGDLWTSLPLGAGWTKYRVPSGGTADDR